MSWINSPGLRNLVAAVPGARRLRNRILGRHALLDVPVSRPCDRGPASTPPGAAALRSAYEAGPLANAPDTFVLYRIIGNDLVPRHRKGQSRANLAFILEHEPVLEGCEKRFVVNRIADATEEQAVIGMLEAAGMPYLHLPFEPAAYRRQPWDVIGVPPGLAPYSAAGKGLDSGWEGRIRMRMYRHKNNYAMNNNGARNAALRDGRGRAKWVLPWDGNCFVTDEAWGEIRAAIGTRPEVPYYIVPMARITDNHKLLRPDFRPEAQEEPQILFRQDTALEFDPEYFYGRRPKVELLWRLGVPGPWDGWTIEAWDLPCPDYAPEAGCFDKAGWVARLSSGRPALENGKDGKTQRGLARIEAVTALLDRLDERILAAALKSDQTVFVGASARQDTHPELLNRLHGAAGEALARGPYSVVDKKTLPPSGDPHDYWHPAPYYWPNPLRIPGLPPFLPSVRRDGKRVPGTRLYEAASDKYDRTRLQRLFDDTFVLALAWSRLGGDQYGRHAAEMVRRWFLEPETAMNPHLEYAQARPGHNRNRGTSHGIIEMKDLYYFLDAVRLLHGGGYLTAAEYSHFQEWLGRYLHWLRSSDQGRRERASSNNHGIYYDLQVGAIAACLGEHLLLRDTLCNSRFRLTEQIDAQGRQPRELARTNTAHYCCFNLQGWIHLAQLAQAAGEDLWSFEGADGQSIRKAMEWLLSHIGAKWPYPQIEAFDQARFYPIYYAYVENYPDASTLPNIPDRASIKPVFFPHDGIRPFWQIR